MPTPAPVHAPARQTVNAVPARLVVVLSVALASALAATPAARAQAPTSPANAAQANLPAPGTQSNLPANTRPISLQDCFDLALRENLDLQIERINPQRSLLDLEIARAGYDPRLTLRGDHSRSVSGSGRDQNNLPYPGSTTEVDAFSAGISGTGPLGFGYNLGGNISDRYGEQPLFVGTNLFIAPFESSAGSISLSMSQPLLRDLTIDGIRYNIAIARSAIKGSELDLQNQVIAIITQVEKAYNNVITARENVKVQEEGLRLARQLLADNRKRVQVGTIAPLDEKQSEAEVYARQADLSGTLQAVTTAQNTLKRLITSNYRTLHDTVLQPTEVLTAVPQKFDIFESWNAGLSKRPNLLQARRVLEQQGITVKYLRNQRLPELDLTGSFGYSGSGAREFNEVFSNITSQDQPFWTIGATASVPLSNKAARENYKRARLTADQQLLALKNLEEAAMVEIDGLVGTLRTALDRIESRRQARLYAEQALEGGQKRLQAGTGTSFEVLQLQRDLINARTAEIEAVKDYNNSLADLHQAEGTTLERRKITLDVRSR